MIHETALIDGSARIGADVYIGPYSRVGPQVVLEDRVRLDGHVIVQGLTRIGSDCRLFSHVVVGTEPQDLSYADEPTRVEIGSGTVLREFVTVNRGTVKGGGLTRVGRNCLLMAYAHVAHDCRVGDGAVLANSIAMAGHVEIGEKAVLGGVAALHQHIRVGRLAMVGGASAVSQDVIPFGMVAGNRARLAGINVIGLRRSGADESTLEVIKRAFKLLMRSGLNTTQAVQRMERDLGDAPEIREIVDFIRSSKRGICKG